MCNGWALWNDETIKTSLETLKSSQGRYLFAGEHLSYLPGWQEGAALSALDVVNFIHEQVSAR